MKDKILDTLFEEWSVNHEGTHECIKACITGNSEDIIISNIAESRLAFIAGFNAAVALLTGGVQ